MASSATGSKKGRLQNSCGEADFVGGGVVVSVDSLGRHMPAVTVYGFAVVVVVIVDIELDSFLNIVPVRHLGSTVRAE